MHASPSATRAAAATGPTSASGTWVAGGSLLAGGHVVLGTIDGADSGDLGERIEVRLSGSRAYTTSLRVPIILIVIGLGIAAVGVRLLVMFVRRHLTRVPSG